MAKSKTSKRYTREFRQELVALHPACAPQLIGTAADQSIAETVWDSYGMMPPC
jgi:hypothetical protein